MGDFKIAFAGASGTGKTALANMVAKKLGIPLCPIGAREVSKRLGFATPYEADKVPGGRMAFQRELVRAKDEWEASQGSFVTDRTHYDNLVYSFLHEPTKLDEQFLKDIEKAHSKYTHVIYVDAIAPNAFIQLEGDPNRVQSLSYHRFYSMLLEGLLHHGAVSGGSRDNVLELWIGTPDLETRMKLVMEFLGVKDGS